MAKSIPYKFCLKFPGDIEYIPAIRKYISDILLANNFNAKFAYRSEIIIDEICNNAVHFGCLSVDAVVELLCVVDNDRIEFIIKDEGGKKEDIEKLKIAVRDGPKTISSKELEQKKQLGLEIVRMISDEVSFEVDKSDVTSIRVVKFREQEENPKGKRRK